MTEIQRRAEASPSRGALRAARGIDRYRLDGKVRETQIDVDLALAEAKVEACTDATVYSMGAVTRVAAKQLAYEQLCPAVSGKLDFLTQDHVLGLCDTMADLRRDLRRR